jgi:hypothetical protein
MMAEWMASRSRLIVDMNYFCVLANGWGRAFKACLALLGVKLYMRQEVELGHGSPCSRTAPIFTYRNMIRRTRRPPNE